MPSELDAVLKEAETEIPRAQEAQALEALRVRFLGKKGTIAAALSGMGKLPPEERRALGEVANTVKARVTGLLDAAATRVDAAELERTLRAGAVDVTLPGRQQPLGRTHPVLQTLDDICTLFSRLGFDVEEGPEIETDFFNFEALNVPADHPARDMQDTFYVASDAWPTSLGPVLLRTHTSPVQIRTMLSRPPPVKAIMPGRVYRKDSDVTHTPMFHQVEGLYVAPNVTFAELKGTLAAFARGFFGDAVKTRFRPSFFPFTEPSAEVDVSCVLCRGQGCRICKGTGWLEVLGSGMVHPNVLRASGYDPAVVSGFAFGMGVERLCMLRLGIDDLRTLFENDQRFLAQF